MSHFYTPVKRLKTKGFLTFSWGIEKEKLAQKGFKNTLTNGVKFTRSLNNFLVAFEFSFE